MKKLLISAALITGCVAPAIFATTQYASVSMRTSTKPVMNTSTGNIGGTGTTNPLRLCMRNTIKDLENEKKKLSESYKQKMRVALAGSTVSGERVMRGEKLRTLQKEYVPEVTQLKENYREKQQNCLKK